MANQLITPNLDPVIYQGGVALNNWDGWGRSQYKHEDFDKCANGTIDPNTGAFITEQKTSSQMQVGGSPEAAVPPAMTKAPAPSQPTTSAPPTPDKEQPTGIDRLQESLKKLLNGVESTVDTIEKGI